MKTNRRSLTLKEFKELHSQRQSNTLTPYERYKIMRVLKNPTQENILIHLYTKFLYFGMREFHQRRFDIQVGVGSYSELTITRNLNSLERKGYFTSEFKKVKGKQYKRLHFNINLEKMNEFLTTGDELTPENFSRLIETLRRENEVVKPNPYTKTHKPTEIDKAKDDILDNNTDSKTTEPAVEVKTVSDDDIPTKDIIKPKNQPNEVTDETTNTTKKEEKIMRKEFMNEVREEIREEDFNEMTKLFMKYKETEGIKPVLNDLMLTFQTINYLYSSDYKKGLNKNLDDKKATLDILYSIKIEPLLNK